jgi:hypothetical protein
VSGGLSTTIHNERVKLTATAVSNAGLAFIGAGFIVPTVGAPLTFGWRSLVALAWIAIGLSLHWIGRVILGRMRQ